MHAHRVVVVALDTVVASDLAIPCDVFGRMRLADDRTGYCVRVCGLTRNLKVNAGPMWITPRYDLDELSRADIIVLPGLSELSRPVPKRLLDALKRAAVRGARVVSICTGAFVLAASGLVDGLRVATHWLAAPELARRFPNVRVDPSVLYVDEGRVLSSAGAAAALDLCLHIIRRDHGARVAADAARMVVMPLERAGGQSQFIVHAAPDAEGVSLAKVLRFMEESSHHVHTSESLARRAGMSLRTFNRRFREQTNSTPLQWLLSVRIRRSQVLLETTNQTVEEVAEAAGFGSPTVFREHFKRALSTSPKAYRAAFKSTRYVPPYPETASHTGLHR
jgi:transcriptional regulator GlxA family with amidase domain